MATIPSVIGVLGNMRMHSPQQITTRKGMVLVGSANPGGGGGLYVHSLKRMNNGASFIRLVGADTKLVELVSAAVVGSGFSGNPLSMVSFRPTQSPQPWMYVADSNKMRKIAMDNTNWLMGVAPPLNPPTAAFGPPSFQNIYDFSGGTIGTDWVAGGTAGTEALQLYLNGNITVALADSGTNFPQMASLFIAAAGTAPTGTLLTFATSPAFTAMSQGSLSVSWATTTINSIVYQSGSTGLATVNVPTIAQRIPDHMIVQLGTGLGNAEYVQVTGCVQNPDATFSFQCTTVNTHAAGETITTEQTFRVFIPLNVTAASLSGTNVKVYAMNPTIAGVTVGTGSWTLTSPRNLSTTLVNGVRPIQTAVPSDTIYIALEASNWAGITSVEVQFDVDATTNNFSGNYYSYTATSGSPLPTSGSALYVLAIPVSSLIRTGSDTTRSLANVAAIRITVVVSINQTQFAVGSFSIGGNYGPAIGSSTAPYVYAIVARSSRTGAESNRSPALRGGFSPAGNGMAIAVYAGNDPDPQVDVLDVYRFGGALVAGFIYIGTMPNPVAGQQSVLFDVFPDSSIASNPVLQTDNFQPFPTIDLPRSGVCNVNGFTVTWVSGDQFNTQWAQGSQITINGIVYNLYQQPQSATSLQILQPGGVLNNVVFKLTDPTILGVPLPCLWGPFAEGTAAYFFACGDVNQPGVLFLTKGNNPDAGPDVLQIEITSPSEPLMNGCMYDGTSFIWSSDRLFRLYPIFGSSIIVTNGTLSPAVGSNLFTPIEVPNGKGLFARWGIAVGPKIWYIGRDGIYETTGGEPKLLTVGDWAQLFPTEGTAGTPVLLGNGVKIQPPDFTQPNKLRLSYYDSILYFDFQDILGNLNTLVYDTDTNAWGYDTYLPAVTLHYGEEGQGVHSVLLGTNVGNVWQFGGNVDGAGSLVVPALTMPLMNEGGGEYTMVREAVFGFLGNDAGVPLITVAMQFEGNSPQTAILPLILGAQGYQRIYIPVPAQKGRLQGWQLTAFGPITIVMRDCEIHVREWGAEGPWKKINPFSNQRRVQAPVVP
jgi:hypothetical protein